MGTLMTFCTETVLSNVVCWTGVDGIVHSTICFGLKGDSFLSFSSASLRRGSRNAMPSESRSSRNLGSL